MTVPASEIEGHTIVVSPGWLRLATIREEEWQEQEVSDPRPILLRLKKEQPVPDLFTFAQKPTDRSPRFNYPIQWENLAVVPITTYEEWWSNRLPQETRKNVRRAEKRKLTVRTALLDDDLVHGIKSIYDEVPIRQGRPFWHYGKSVAAVRRDNATYLSRSEFIGAFLGEELVGFLKLVYTGKVGSIMQIVSKNVHQDKRPGNALLAKAVEVCVGRGMSYLVYGQFSYGKSANSPLTVFKQRNGFEKIMVPRYYIPLTIRGRLALACHLHRGFREVIPGKIEETLMHWRARFYQRQLGSKRAQRGALPTEHRRVA